MSLVYWLFVEFVHVLPIFKFGLGQVHKRIHTLENLLGLRYCRWVFLYSFNLLHHGVTKLLDDGGVHG